VPGVAFGLEPYFRVSYATSLELLTDAMDRIERSVSSLS
jgi:aspartate aminotransferase